MSGGATSAGADRHGQGERIAELEARFAFLDEQVQQLDALVVSQRDLLDTLADELGRIKESLESMRPDLPDGGPEPPPPHY
ncbi:MAG: SlyX family protein [Pseudomonadales bacterium]|nr:SlyX family protein [Pseudomonadales bacterium]